MSHELRTPLNSLLVLAEQLEDNPDGQPHRAPGPVRPRHPLAPAATCSSSSTTSSTWPRSSPTRSSSRSSDALARRAARQHAADLPADRRRARAWRSPSSSTTSCRATIDDRPAPAAAGAQEPALQRVQVHRARRRRAAPRAGTSGWSPDHERLARADSVIAISVSDTGIGIKQRTARRDVRGVRAGRRHDRAQVRRDRARALDQPQPRRAARRRDHARRASPECGSTFTVYLPLERMATPSAAPEQRRRSPTRLAGVVRRRRPPSSRWQPRRPHAAASSSTTGSAAGATVLVVDDDFRNIFALTALLERGEVDVVAAQSGADGAGPSSTSAPTSTSC